MDFQELARHPETDPSDKPGEYEWPFQRGAMVSLKVGGTVIYLRSVPKAPPPPVRYLETRDPKLLLSFLGVLLFSGALVWRAVTWPPTPAVLLEDRLKLDEKMVSFLINPEERLRRAKIYGAKLSSDDKEEGGALKGPEGKSGARDAPKVKRRLAIAGKEKEYTPAQQRERDLKRVRRLGALAALEKDAELREIFTGGGGGGPGSEFGRGRGGGPDDMTAWGGVGDGPPGESYGLGGFGQGGEGGGGGGIGSYVGIGRLSTRGGYGGRGGSRFGSGVARLREHRTEQPKVVVGEPDVGGGLTREIIRRVIRSHLHEIRYCYERELQKTPDLYGKVVVKFTILPSGNVENSEIFNSTMGNENVEGCMLARVVRWKFPKPYKGASVIVKYPFLFKAAGKD
jgi:TonB family protein